MQTQQDIPARELVETASELATQAKEQAEVATENLLDTLADQLEDFAAQLRKEDLSSLLEHARSTASRSPELFFAGSVATGLALARFVKASAHKREEQQRGAEQRSDSEATARQPQQSPPPEVRSVSPAASPPPLPMTSSTELTQ